MLENQWFTLAIRVNGIFKGYLRAGNRLFDFCGIPAVSEKGLHGGWSHEARSPPETHESSERISGELTGRLRQAFDTRSEHRNIILFQA
jgi:hypothetical protein